MRTINWKDGVVITIDQTKLPTEFVLIKASTCEEIAGIIRDMKVRGAPLIGVAAAFGLALTAFHSKAQSKEDLLKELEKCAKTIRSTRPTAVNLFWAVNRIMKKANETRGTTRDISKAVVNEALEMAEEDIRVNKAIGHHGSRLIESGDTVLTHCNAGALACVDYGTALGVVRAAIKKGKNVKVIATETRPKLQGARLTTFELMKDRIPVTLISDTMVGYAMWKGLVSKVIVGADRILKTGHVLNKIGTYNIAVLAKTHGIPFFVAAPISTLDLKTSVQEVVIEHRSPDEVLMVFGHRIAPTGVTVWNPAFDITPPDLITAIITEKGLLHPTKITVELSRLLKP